MKALPLPALQAGAGLGSQGIRPRPMLSPKLAEGHETRGLGSERWCRAPGLLLFPGLALCSHFRAVRALSALSLGSVAGVVMPSLPERARGLLLCSHTAPPSTSQRSLSSRQVNSKGPAPACHLFPSLPCPEPSVWGGSGQTLGCLCEGQQCFLPRPLLGPRLPLGHRPHSQR